jgi:Holliday junction resolvase
MRFDTFSALTAICQRWPFEHGKIIQLLLAISFDKRRGGYAVENRSSEGVDLELISDRQKFAIEVKTTEGSQVTIQEKDISGLQARATADGYTPAIAALQLQKSADWVIANARKLCARDYTPARLSLDSISELELLAKNHFEKTVIELRDDFLLHAGSSPLSYLSEILINESR